MAKKANQTSFKPGQSGNPAGRVKMPTEVKEAKRMTQESAITMFNLLAHATKEELSAIIKDPTTNVMTLALAQVLIKGIQNGDQARVNFIFDRMLGKVKEQVEHSTGSDGFNVTVTDYTVK